MDTSPRWRTHPRERTRERQFFCPSCADACFRRIAQQLLFEPMVLKIGINGFGRIGRLVMRAAKADPAVQVRALN